MTTLQTRIHVDLAAVKEIMMTADQILMEKNYYVVHGHIKKAKLLIKSLDDYMELMARTGEFESPRKGEPCQNG